MKISSSTKAKIKELGEDVAPEVLAIGLGQTAGVIEEFSGFPVTLLLEAGMTIYEIIEAVEKNEMIANPKLMLHGLGEGNSPQVKHYMRVRKAKKIGGAIYSFTGTGLQVGLDVAGFGMGGVDAFGLAKHGAAEASTVAHLTRLAILSRKVKGSRYLTDLLEDIVKVKLAKATVRGGKLAAAAIPNSIASNVVSIAVSLGAATASSLLKELVNRVACELHWRAYQELTIGRVHGGGFGPACKMVQEIMNHTLSTDFVPTPDTKKFLLEPGGYLVIKDKLSML